MSMQSYSSNGYLVKASDLTKALPERIRAKYATAVENCEVETSNQIVEDNWPEQLPPVITIFTLADDAEFDDENLQKGEMYAMFDEGDLFKKVPTLAHSNLLVEGLTPIFHSWVDCS
jgi:hypothetical protein